jgi:hypothetical protein
MFATLNPVFWLMTFVASLKNECNAQRIGNAAKRLGVQFFNENDPVLNPRGLSPNTILYYDWDLSVLLGQSIAPLSRDPILITAVIYPA